MQTVLETVETTFWYGNWDVVLCRKGLKKEPSYRFLVECLGKVLIFWKFSRCCFSAELFKATPHQNYRVPFVSDRARDNFSKVRDNFIKARDNFSRFRDKFSKAHDNFSFNAVNFRECYTESRLIFPITPLVGFCWCGFGNYLNKGLAIILARLKDTSAQNLCISLTNINNTSHQKKKHYQYFLSCNK